MSKIFLFGFIFSLLAAGAYAQDNKTAKPDTDMVALYQKYPALPAFNIGMMDSVSVFNTYNIPKGNIVGIYFFSPDCGHCKRTMRRLTDSMDMLKDIRFYMITPYHGMAEIQKFYSDFHLDKYKNIVLVGRDNEFFFGSYYGVKFVPDLVLYDKEKKLIKLIQGETTAKAVYEALHP